MTLVLLFLTNCLVVFNPISKRHAQHLKKAFLTLICQCPSTTKINIHRKKTSEKVTEYEWNKMNRYINVQIQPDQKWIGLREKKLKGHKNDSKWTKSEYERMDFKKKEALNLPRKEGAIEKSGNNGQCRKIAGMTWSEKLDQDRSF